MARASEKRRDDTFRNYVADGVQILTENTAKVISALAKNGAGKIIKDRYSDLVSPKKKEPHKSGQEIADNIIGRLTKKE